MLIHEIKNIKSGRKELKDFGLVVGGVFLALGVWSLWRGKPVGPYLTGFGGTLMILGWAVPLSLKPIQKVWMAFALVMGAVMTRVLLTVFFYLVMTPIGLLGRLVGKRFLDPGPLAGDSAWIQRPNTDGVSQYEKQF